jgi:FixJ family two-component response regulator
MAAADPQLILIVEDDPSVRRAMSRLLCSAGYATRMFGSAEEASDSPALQAAHCLLIDIQLSGMSGTSWYASLGPGRAPAVFVTAFDSAQIRAQAQEAGASAYLMKPFEGQALMHAVSAAIDKAHR